MNALWKIFFASLMLLAWQVSVEAGQQEQTQTQTQTQTATGGIADANGGVADVENKIPPGFVEPFPGVPIPPGYLEKKAKSKYVFNDIPADGVFKVEWISNDKTIFMVPEGNPFFYSQRRIGISNYSWIRLKGRTASPYKHVADFTVFGAKEGFFSQSNTLQEVQEQAADIVGHSASFSDEIITILSVDVQPQSVSSGIMPAGSAASSNSEVVGGVGMGKSSNHLTSRAVVTAHVFKPLLKKDLVPKFETVKPTVWTIQFDFDKSNLDETATAILDGLIVYLADYQEPRIEVAGHTCAIGTDSYNYALSERRADSVIRYLIAHGIVAKALTQRGYGESAPLNENETPDCRIANRRAEISLVN